MARFTDAGAHFFRCDFQVHTPRDDQWSGPRAVSDEERRDYARHFVAGCRQKALQAVAITDHHDFVMLPYIREAAANEQDDDGRELDERDRLVVFPGLELTLGVPCQAILILDADLPDDRLPLVLEALAIDPVPDSAPRLGPVTRIEHIDTLEKLYADLDQRTWLKGRYTVLPNVTDGGMGTLMRSGMQVKYKNMPCVGGYLDGLVATKAKPKSGNRTKFDGRDANWGNKRIALFQTSDSRSHDLAELGVNSTWVKWAAPTAEALRQACLAQESRIHQEAPALPAVHIKHVRVSNSKFMGPVDLNLNPQYNALIGGRGTGKSSILTYVRWCLADQQTEDLEDGIAGRQRERRLLLDTLAGLGASVEVTVSKNDVEHVVRRDATTGEITLKVGSSDFQASSEAAVRSLLPVHAYGQKQLSSVSVRVDELTRFVTAPIVKALEERDATIGELSDRLRENYGTLQRKTSIERAAARDEVQEQSLANQAARLRAELSGVSPEDDLVLAQRPLVDRSKGLLASWVQTGRRRAADVDATIESVQRSGRELDEPIGIDGALGESMEAVRDVFAAATRTLAEDLAAARARFEASTATERQESTVASATRLLEQQDTHYAAVVARAAAHTQQLEQLTSVDAERQKLAAVVNGRRQELLALGDPAAVHRELRSKLREQYAGRTSLLATQCAVMTEASDGMLDAKVAQGAGIDAVQHAFRGAASGSGIRAAKLDSVFENLRLEVDALATWDIVLDELEALLASEDGTDVTTENAPTLGRLGLTAADIMRLRGKLTVDSWLVMALTPIVDEPVFRYRTTENEFIPFESASAGQQATALLRVLLAQEGMPLVIDQPEEDLDSQVIQDVVSWLWSAKSRRQIIFASHNANLVVNGDAELVVVCDYRNGVGHAGGRIRAEGAIDVPAVRQEITRVMEGGEKAFRLRQEKYGF